MLSTTIYYRGQKSPLQEGTKDWRPFLGLEPTPQEPVYK